MSKKGSRMVDNSYVPMIGCFVAGFVVNRLMNHQDVVTGDVEEGADTPPVIKGIVGFIAFCFAVGGLVHFCGKITGVEDDADEA